MARDSDREFLELFERLKRQAPFAARFLEWLRRPSSRLIRVPLGLLLVVGGIFSILPLLGIWMLPLGLLLLALDVPPLRRPLVVGVAWVEGKWKQWQARRAARKQR